MTHFSNLEKCKRFIAILGGAYLVRLFWLITKNKKSRVRAIILDDKEDSVLLVKNLSYNYFHLPGGAIEKDESPEMAIRREVREELGIEITIVKKFSKGFYEGSQKSIEIFLCTTKQSVIVPQWELSAAGWFKFDNLPKLKITTADALHAFLEDRQPKLQTWPIDD